MTPGKPLVFDSYALLKLFQKETGYREIVRILEEAKGAHASLFINAINLGEIIYRQGKWNPCYWRP